MNYYVARNGQTYGPYSEETVRKYLAEGSMQAADLGRTDSMPNWAPLGQILGTVQGMPAALAPPPAYAPAYTPQPVLGQMGPGMNIPPSLHWAIVLLVAAFSSGIFITIWAFVQANWIRTIDPASKAVRDLAIGVAGPLLGLVVFVIMMIIGGAAGLFSGGSQIQFAGPLLIGFLFFMGLTTGGFVFTLLAFFGMRGSMERYYNSTEPINLRLSPVMTFFFNVIYLQYHMTRIADWKRTGLLRP